MNFVTKANVKLTELFRICFEQNIPFVSYYLPNSDVLNIIIQYKSLPRKVSQLSDIASLKGFVIAPFDLHNHRSVYFFEPDLHIITGVTDEHLNILKVIKSFQHTKASKVSVLSTKQEEYIQQVTESKRKISEGNFEKVVLSRVLVESVNKMFNPTLFLNLVHQSYPNTLRYIFNIPGVGCWMGATPEPLLNIKGTSVEVTSLAGTQKLHTDLIDDVAWSTKELIEQRFVTNYIEEAIKKFNEPSYTKEGPVNFRAANVIHLKSVFTIHSKYILSHLGEFIQELHPTPSVCGIPKQEAQIYVKSLEKHSREYYSGFLGPLNLTEETQLFVNLRCLQYTGDNYIYYAGAGITSGSEPGLEWEETNQKLVAMLSIIQQVEH